MQRIMSNITRTGSVPDYPNFNFPFQLWLVRPEWECALKIGFFVPVVAFSLLGNGFVIFLMATNRFLRTSVNIFIWNLAIADLLAIILIPWIILGIDLYQMFVLGSVICQIEAFLRGILVVIRMQLIINASNLLRNDKVTLMLVDVFSLVAVSYDRFVAVAFPFRRKMSHVMAYLISGFIWVLAVSVAAPLITARTYKVLIVCIVCIVDINFNDFL